MKRALVHLSFGTAFGFVLSRNGAADFDAMLEMFLFRDFHLFGVAIVTTSLSALGLWVVRRKMVVSGLRWRPRPVHRGSVLGGVIFGVGWAISGACPGTALVQLGEGHVIALATVAGVLIGNAIYQPFNRYVLRLPPPSCS